MNGPDTQDINPELESFREQWRAEARTPRTPQNKAPSISESHADRYKATIPERSRRPIHPSPGKPRVRDIEDYAQAPFFDDCLPAPPARNIEEEDGQMLTALENYEHAVEKEAQGSLGDSLRFYRKAFRMDHMVDQKYRSKHFPAVSAPTPSKPNLSTGPSAAHMSYPSSTEEQPMTIDDLVMRFSGASIEHARPNIEGIPQPPCPMAELPGEILVHILEEVALSDVGDFVRLSRVCKKLAWLVVTEDTIWRQVCLGPKFGFDGMHYDFQTSASWKPLAEERTPLYNQADGARRGDQDAYATTVALLNTVYQNSWRRMFRTRPRIRFNGCYISTINYIRAGQQTSSLTLNSPVHIVTYYRYLRMFRDGTAITLCTVEEPANVVHYMTRGALVLHEGSAMAHLPSSMMQYALRARWRLSSAADNTKEAEARAAAGSEGDLFVEYDGGGNYLYRMDLSLRTAGQCSRNNKLVWNGFYSYNKSRNVWDEFSLKDVKPFHFSRVKSYGFGEL